MEMHVLIPQPAFSFTYIIRISPIPRLDVALFSKYTHVVDWLFVTSLT